MTSYTAIIDTRDTSNIVLKSPASVSDSVGASIELQKSKLGVGSGSGSGTSKLKPSKQTINLSSLKKIENTTKLKKRNNNVGDDDEEDDENVLGTLADLEELDDIDLAAFDSELPSIVNTNIDSLFRDTIPMI